MKNLMTTHAFIPQWASNEEAKNLGAIDYENYQSVLSKVSKTLNGLAKNL